MHFFMNDVFAAPASAFPSFPTALVSQLSCANAAPPANATNNTASITFLSMVFTPLSSFDVPDLSADGPGWQGTWASWPEKLVRPPPGQPATGERSQILAIKHTCRCECVWQIWFRFPDWNVAHQYRQRGQTPWLPWMTSRDLRRSAPPDPATSSL